MTFTLAVRSRRSGVLCAVMLALAACGAESARPTAGAPSSSLPHAANDQRKRQMSKVAVAFAEALALRDFDTAAKQLMGPEVCAEAPASQRARCQDELQKNTARIRAELPNLAREFPPGFRVSDVSFEPLPGAGALEGATVRLHPSSSDQPGRSLMVGWIRDRAYVMIALPAPERERERNR